MIAWRPTSLKAMACVGCRAAVAMAITWWTRSGCEIAHCSACMPPMEPPTTASSRSMPRWSSSSAWASTMSATVMIGKCVPYGRPVRGSTDEGPVDPLQPPMTFEEMTKYFSVSSALPGPMSMSHQPGRLSSGECRPATCASPDSACSTSTALSARGESVPYVS